MSWKDKDWDFLTFYGNDRITLEKAAADFLLCNKNNSAYFDGSNVRFICNKNNSAYLDGSNVRFIFKDGELKAYRSSKDICPPNDYDKNMLQSIANYHNVCVCYTWLSSYRMFDLKPIPEE